MHRRLGRARAFVFDFYGTLIEDDATVPPMWCFLRELGFDSHPELEAAFEPNAFDGCRTPTHAAHDAWFDAHWRAFLRLSGVPRAREDVTLARLLCRRQKFAVRRVAGVERLLAMLRERHVALAICSNWETPIEPYLERARLAPFDAIITSRACGARKPHPVIFSEACRQLGVEPAEAVFVGDTWEVDVIGALRAGLQPVWVRHGRPSREVARHVVEVDSISDLAVLLERVDAAGPYAAAPSSASAIGSPPYAADA